MDFTALVDSQREVFGRGGTRSAGARLERLAALRDAIEAHETELLAALREDLGKPETEAYVSEVAPVLAEIRHATRHLGKWMKPRGARVPFLAWPGRAQVVAEPFGVALVIGPWNYPFQLLFAPLVGALAAGNRALLKPSEIAPRTAAVAAKIIRAAFSDGLATVVEGDHTVAEALLRERFDFIFFTGGSATGRIVMQAAARHLTPVALELGGKCPVIVCADACRGSAKALATVARRITWGKLLNAGQTCVAPDHVWVERAVHDELVAALAGAIAEAGDSAAGRIVNQRHFDRVTGYIGDGRVACGGGHDAARLWIAPTVLTEVDPASRVMREEIFGPVLPVLPWDEIEEPLAWIAAGPSPLAVYLFSGDSAVQDRVVAETRSGGVCVNDTVVHITGQRLPFGGVGESGMGRYHGKAGFDCFSHQRVVMRRGLGFDPGFRNPGTTVSLERLKQVLRLFGGS